LAKLNQWTLRGVINKFIDTFTKEVDKIENGSYNFCIHFRNGKMEKVVINSVDNFGGEKE